MLINGNNYNFGRLIYLTIIRNVSNNALQSKTWTQQALEQSDNITICFDPKRDTKFNTRIDFYVKHLGDAGVGNNGYFTTEERGVSYMGQEKKDLQQKNF